MRENNEKTKALPTRFLFPDFCIYLDEVKKYFFRFRSCRPALCPGMPALILYVLGCNSNSPSLGI